MIVLTILICIMGIRAYVVMPKVSFPEVVTPEVFIGTPYNSSSVVDIEKLITKPIDGNVATCANGGTIGFAMASPEQADAWHAAGVANGGTAIEDPPGEREGSGMYLAYLRDPDGNKLCALHRYG